MSNQSKNDFLTCLTVFGARPQFIKAAPLSRAFKKMHVKEIAVHTGQHFDPEMSDIFFSELGMNPPQYNLNIAGGSHTQMVAKMMLALEPILQKEKIDWMVVFGDTNSTLAAALVAAQNHIPLAHIEAGLRSYHWRMPEEKNRKITDHLSQLLLCPTRQAITNLHAEGITNGVIEVGDLMYDLALQVEDIPSVLSEYQLQTKCYDLMTLHRAECCDDPVFFSQVIHWLIQRMQNTQRALIWPIHPRARMAIEKYQITTGDIILAPPISYGKMATLIKNSVEVYTDSGGVQREAFFHHIPCTTLRYVSEWPETIIAGWNRLWSDRDKSHVPLEKRGAVSGFGQGNAANKIVESLIEHTSSDH
jgi:UDP-GlcNAc3NAcA epimerase